MFTLAHFSDPHIGPLPEPSARELLSKRITGYLNYRCNRKGDLVGGVLERLLSDLQEQKPDHIALTGDLVNIALPGEMKNARAWLETVAPPARLSLVPGNHDAYVPGALDAAKRLWSPYWLGDGTSAEDPVRFPYLRQRGPLALVALSTAIATAPFLATGTLGKRQIEEAGSLLRRLAGEGRFRVVLIHHPPFLEKGRRFKRLTDYGAFNAMIASAGAELVLHGHTHKRSRTALDGPKGPIPVIGVPSASSGLSGSHEPARYNLFHIGGEAENWHCVHVERGLAPSGAFGELHRTVL